MADNTSTHDVDVSNKVETNSRIVHWTVHTNMQLLDRVSKRTCMDKSSHVFKMGNWNWWVRSILIETPTFISTMNHSSRFNRKLCIGLYLFVISTYSLMIDDIFFLVWRKLYFVNSVSTFVPGGFFFGLDPIKSKSDPLIASFSIGVLCNNQIYETTRQGNRKENQKLIVQHCAFVC